MHLVGNVENFLPIVTSFTSPFHQMQCSGAKKSIGSFEPVYTATAQFEIGSAVFFQLLQQLFDQAGSIPGIVGYNTKCGLNIFASDGI